jgi:hypothetical protein
LGFWWLAPEVDRPASSNAARWRHSTFAKCSASTKVEFAGVSSPPAPRYAFERLSSSRILCSNCCWEDVSGKICCCETTLVQSQRQRKSDAVRACGACMLRVMSLVKPCTSIGLAARSCNYSKLTAHHRSYFTASACQSMLSSPESIPASLSCSCTSLCSS